MNELAGIPVRVQVSEYLGATGYASKLGQMEKSAGTSDSSSDMVICFMSGRFHNRAALLLTGFHKRGRYEASQEASATHVMTEIALNVQRQ